MPELLRKHLMQQEVQMHPGHPMTEPVFELEIAVHSGPHEVRQSLVPVAPVSAAVCKHSAASGEPAVVGSSSRRPRSVDIHGLSEEHPSPSSVSVSSRKSASKATVKPLVLMANHQNTNHECFLHLLLGCSRGHARARVLDSGRCLNGCHGASRCQCSLYDI